jgi:Phosphodiester glycosidase
VRLLGLGVALLAAMASAPAGAGRPTAPVAVPDPVWRATAAGLERAVVEVSAPGEGWRTRVVAVRIDPARFRFTLRARLRGIHPGWSVDRAPATAALAVNAGQFSGFTPWGWVVMDGREIRPPGHGPLSTAIAWDRNGRARWLDGAGIDASRTTGEIVEAFQSYPTLLDGQGRVPAPLHDRRLGVDVDHRDGRLAVGGLKDGRLLVALTRFYGFGEMSPPLPFGLTLGEMAEVMRRLGCRRAVSLDGGVSAQLLVRDDPRRTLIWRGWRPVPLGLVAEPINESDQVGSGVINSQSPTPNFQGSR